MLDLMSSWVSHLILALRASAGGFSVHRSALRTRARPTLDVVEKATHKTPVVYTNAFWWKERIGPIGSMQKALGHYPIWISDLSAKGLKVEQPYIYKGGWYMWQFTFTARPEKGGLPPGGSVDADVFAGDMAKLKGHSN